MAVQKKKPPRGRRLALLLQPRHPHSRVLGREGGMVGGYANSDKTRDTSPEGSIGEIPGEGRVSVPHRRDIVS